MQNVEIIVRSPFVYEREHQDEGTRLTVPRWFAAEQVAIGRAVYAGEPPVQPRPGLVYDPQPVAEVRDPVPESKKHLRGRK